MFAYLSLTLKAIVLTFWENYTKYLERFVEDVVLSIEYNFHNRIFKNVHGVFIFQTDIAENNVILLNCNLTRSKSVACKARSKVTVLRCT